MHHIYMKKHFHITLHLITRHVSMSIHRNLSGNKMQYNVKVFLRIYGAFVGV
jgi:hypothetical protein